MVKNSRARSKTLAPRQKTLRSQLWFDNPDNPSMTALYLERYMNYGLTGPELRSGKPIIGIAQTGSDLAPCNRHHLELAKRVRDGIRDAGGIAFEFPCHPIQETGKRPTAALDRNLAYLSLVEVLYGYPLDGVVLLTAQGSAVLKAFDVVSCDTYKYGFHLYLTLFDGIFYGRLYCGHCFCNVGNHASRYSTLTWGFSHAEDV